MLSAFAIRCVCAAIELSKDFEARKAKEAKDAEDRRKAAAEKAKLEQKAKEVAVMQQKQNALVSEVRCDRIVDHSEVQREVFVISRLRMPWTRSRCK